MKIERVIMPNKLESIKPQVERLQSSVMCIHNRIRYLENELNDLMKMIDNPESFVSLVVKDEN